MESKKSPQIIRNVEGEIGMYYDAGYFTYEYEVGDYEFLLILLFLKNIGCIPKLIYFSNQTVMHLPLLLAI